MCISPVLQTLQFNCGRTPFTFCKASKTEGVGFYHKRPKTILYMVANAFETQKIIDAIKLIDSEAFIEISSVDRIEGNYRQKPLE